MSIEFYIASLPVFLIGLYIYKKDTEDININRADINGDGEVNSADALQVLQTSVGLVKPVKYCDCAE